MEGYSKAVSVNERPNHLQNEVITHSSALVQDQLWGIQGIALVSAIKQWRIVLSYLERYASRGRTVLGNECDNLPRERITREERLTPILDKNSKQQLLGFLAIFLQKGKNLRAHCRREQHVGRYAPTDNLSVASYLKTRDHEEPVESGPNHSKERREKNCFNKRMNISRPDQMLPPTKQLQHIHSH